MFPVFLDPCARVFPDSANPVGDGRVVDGGRLSLGQRVLILWHEYCCPGDILPVVFEQAEWFRVRESGLAGPSSKDFFAIGQEAREDSEERISGVRLWTERELS
ncbi:hypothetical protein BMH25_10730 [Leucobacter sp. OLCALW19]|nr:hypothetical protein BMH25_10730 [Leucobacter sp. OLCALW19]